jgi:hypothetical protein
LTHLENETEHVRSSIGECTMIVSARLESDGKDRLKPISELDKPLIIRPMSEIIRNKMIINFL